MATKKSSSPPVSERAPTPSGEPNRSNPPGERLLFFRGIRKKDPDTWRVLLNAVRVAQGNLEEVSRQLGISRETLRRWEKSSPELKKEVENAVRKNPILLRQRTAWSPERRRATAERERQHQKQLSRLNGATVSDSTPEWLPTGVRVGKRAWMVVQLKSPVDGSVVFVPGILLRATKKCAFVAYLAQGQQRVRRVLIRNLRAWEASTRGLSRRELDFLTEVEEGHTKCFKD